MPETKEPRSSAAFLVSIGKDLVALLRDGTLVVLAALLIAFPVTFNTMLVKAGFEEGSLVGFKWKSSLVESNKALTDAQATIADLQGRNEELSAALKEANAKLHDPALTERISKLEGQNRSLQASTQQVQATVSRTIESNTPLVEKALSAPGQRPTPVHTKADYLVGLQTLGVPDSERISINEKLRAEGYGLDPITYSYAREEKPAWFAGRSTVFYYSAASFQAAQDLGQVLKSLTGRDFVVQRGAGLGVDPSRRDVTLFVHYVKG